MKQIRKGNRKTDCREGMLLCGILTVFAFLLRDPALTAATALQGGRIFLRAVLPSTLPYMVLAGLLCSGDALTLPGRKLRCLRRWLWISEDGVSVLLMGILSGFPVGAKMAAALYSEGRISREEAQRLSAYCNFCGPPFLLGVVGAGLPGGHRAGLLLWLLQLLLSLLYGHLSGVAAKRKGLPLPKAASGPICARRFSLRFYTAVRSACDSMLLIGGFVLFFAIFTGICREVMGSLGVPDSVQACFCGVMELSAGTAAISALSLPVFPKALLLGMSSVFSGMSVHLQVSAFLLPAGLGMGRYYRARLLLSPLAGLLSAMLVTAIWG